MIHRMLCGAGKAKALALALVVGSLLGVAPVHAADPAAVGLAGDPAADVVNFKLLKGVKSAKSKGVSLVREFEDWIVSKNNDGAIAIEIIFEKGKSSIAKTTTVPGAKVYYVSDHSDRAYAWVYSPDAVLEMAEWPGVRMVRPEWGAMTSAGSVDGKGPAAHNTELAWQRFRIDGRIPQGETQKVGILSDSFAMTDGMRDFNTEPGRGQPGILTGSRPQDTGDLPPEVNILREIPVNQSATDEGAGMAELVHDMVPDAGIAFHSAFGGQALFADGIRRLANEANCTVVVDDVIFFAEPMFQNGLIGQAARDVVTQGVPYFSSAGNNDNFGFRFEYNDFDPATSDEANPPSGVDMHRFENGTRFLEIKLAPGAFGQVIMQWNQPFGSLPDSTGAEIDLDLLFYERPNVFAPLIDEISSRDLQGTPGNPLGDALEIATFVSSSDVEQTIYMAIDGWDGPTDVIPQDNQTPLEVRMFLRGGITLPVIEDKTSLFGGPTIYGHNSAPGAASVAAVPWFDTPNFDPTFTPSRIMDPEDFSSRGGDLTIFFDDEGNLDPITDFEPDIAAVDGNNTTFFGSPLNLGGFEGEPDRFPNFFGTSAAAPNAAAIAAIMLDMDPTLTPAEIIAIMQETAIDVSGFRAAPGVDDVTGPGLIDTNEVLGRVAERLGIDPLTPPPPLPDPVDGYTFDFEEDPIEWSSNPTAAVFTEPFRFFDDGSLGLQSRNNTNTFGFLLSPPVHASNAGLSNQERGDIALAGSNGEDTLYRASFTVSSDRPTTDLLRVPVMRMRSATENFEQSNVLVVSSASGSQQLSPGTRAKTFNLYFKLPPTQDKFRLFYDILNVEGADAPSGALLLDRVRIEALEPSLSLQDRETEKTLNFVNQGNDWKVIPDLAGDPDSTPFFSIPQFGLSPKGLRMGPAANGVQGQTNTHFAFWSSPDDFSNTTVAEEAVKMRTGRLFEATFRMRANPQTPDEASRLPTFRMRMNDRSLNYSSYVNIESVGPNANLPMDGSPVEYKLYFEGRGEIDQNELIFAFDYLLTEGSGNDVFSQIFLESLDIVSYEIPL